LSIDEPRHSDLRTGVRAGLPLVAPTFLLAVSFGVIAEPVMGKVAPVVMSVVVFAGAAQFAALSVLAAGGAAGAAIAAGLMLNLRFLPMGLALAPSVPGRAPKRAAQGQALVDASWALASRGDGSFDRGVLLGASIPQFVAWTTGTAAGVVGGAAITDPASFGLDAIFPAFYLALLAEEVRGRRALAAALAGAAITITLMPVAPPGLPVLAAALAALLGLRRP
jgi:predicted branched-subunit amino acid permease